MSLDFRYLTNGKKTLYCVVDSGVWPVEKNTYETIEEVPEGIRHIAPKEPTFVTPDCAQSLGFGKELYPEYEKRCSYYSGRRFSCVGETCTVLGKKKPQECEYWND